MSHSNYKLSEIERIHAFTALILARKALEAGGSEFEWEEEFAARLRLTVMQVRRLRLAYDIKVLEITSPHIPFNWSPFYLGAAASLEGVGFYSEAAWCWGNVERVVTSRPAIERMAARREACERKAEHQARVEADLVGVR